VISDRTAEAMFIHAIGLPPNAPFKMKSTAQRSETRANLF